MPDDAKEYLLCKKEFEHAGERSKFYEGVVKAQSVVKSLADARNPDGRYGEMVGRVSWALYHGYA